MCSINRIDVLNEYEIAATVKLTKVCGMKDATVLWTAHLDPVVCSVAASRCSFYLKVFICLLVF